MKVLFCIAALAFASVPGVAQSNILPARLGIVIEGSAIAAAGDLLTAELSKRAGLEVLERSEIEKIYREQQLSTVNKDHLKVGKILGADGMLLLEALAEGTNHFLGVRLVAVKPGVVLSATKFPWPMNDVTEWASSFSKKLDAYLPKLAISEKDAIPLSVVNLRSAITSADSPETERQLKLLAIERLSQEPQFFVLERQRLQLLSDEKDLKADESAFWSGSYLVEGTADQNGFSKEVITIHARLTPPKGSEPVLFEVNGSRTNLAEVINRLAIKVSESLKIKPAVKDWNPGDEAAQYLEQAKWALKWRVFREAQAASDSAWALGRRDVDCATVRLKAYLAELSRKAVCYEQTTLTTSPELVQSSIRFMLSGSPPGSLYRQKCNDSMSTVISFAFPTAPPDPRNIVRVKFLLELYYTFSRTQAEGVPGVRKAANGYRHSEWDDLGIEVLVAASRVLQDFNLFPGSKPIPSDLGELRALARVVAEFISTTPAVYQSYFVGNRIATRDELGHTIDESPNIFRCKVEWGCFWQERPEETLALYRELMSSPVFCYIHENFWNRDVVMPRLVAWNEADRKRIPALWAGFCQELNNSTNVLLQMEAKGLARADAQNRAEVRASEAEWWNLVRSHREELAANNVDLFYLGWRFADNAETQAICQDYWRKTIPARKTLEAFEAQRKHLVNFTPYEFFSFSRTFSQRNYSKQQASELRPLIAAYKSNLLAAAARAPRKEQLKAQSAARLIELSVEKRVDEILNPSPPLAPALTQQTKPAIASTPTVTPTAVTNAPETVTNIIVLKQFHPIPLERLEPQNTPEVSVRSHHVQEGKLLLDLIYNLNVDVFDSVGKWQSARNVTRTAVALFDPESLRWELVACPESDLIQRNAFYHRTVLAHGTLFTSTGGKISKYDPRQKQWHELEIPDSGNYALFFVNDHLYAANTSMIFEILDDGRATRLLASNRRQPPVSLLDSEKLGAPALFEGPSHSLRVSTPSRIYSWAGEDWREACSMPQTTLPPVIDADGVLFRTAGGISFLATEASNMVVYLRTEVRADMSGLSSAAVQDMMPLWNLPSGLVLPNLAAAVRQSDLYLMLDHSEARNIVDKRHNLVVSRSFLPKDGYHAALLCYSRELPLPQKLFLKFDAPEGCPPVSGLGPGSFQVLGMVSPSWMAFTTNFLLFGLEAPFNVPYRSDGMSIGCKAGIWRMPVSQVETARTSQKRLQLAQKARDIEAVQEVWRNFLVKYDRNQNGVIDPAERGPAMDDEKFLESELDKIDHDHDNWLEPKELAYFDANEDKALQPKEESGIRIALRLLSARLLKRFDTNDDNALNQFEFNVLCRSYKAVNPHSSEVFAFSDVSQNGQADLNGVKTVVQRQYFRGLAIPQVRPSMSGVALNRVGPATNGSFARQQSVKSMLEAYWQNTGDTPK